MQFVLRRTRGRTAWVGQAGRTFRYTDDIALARRFDTEDQARENAMPHEAVQPVD